VSHFDTILLYSDAVNTLIAIFSGAFAKEQQSVKKNSRKHATDKFWMSPAEMRKSSRQKVAELNNNTREISPPSKAVARKCSCVYALYRYRSM